MGGRTECCGGSGGNPVSVCADTAGTEPSVRAWLDPSTNPCRAKASPGPCSSHVLYKRTQQRPVGSPARAPLPDSGCRAFSREGTGSFRRGRLSDASCPLNSPGLSGNFLRPLVLAELVTLQLPIALVKRFVCSSLLAGSELGVNPPRDRAGEFSEQSICRGVCNPSAKELDSEGSLLTHCSSLLSKPLEGDR